MSDSVAAAQVEGAAGATAAETATHESMSSSMVVSSMVGSSMVSSSEVAAAPAAHEAAASDKVIVTLMAIGRVPQLKQNKVSMPGTRTMAELSSFIRKKLSLDPKNNLCLFLNSAFQPSSDQTVGALATCFSNGKKLGVHYSLEPTWG